MRTWTVLFLLSEQGQHGPGSLARVPWAAETRPAVPPHPHGFLSPSGRVTRCPRLHILPQSLCGQFVTLHCIYSQKRVLTEGKGTERPEPQVPNTAELRPGRAGEDSPRADVLALGEHVEVFPVQL